MQARLLFDVAPPNADATAEAAFNAQPLFADLLSQAAAPRVERTNARRTASARWTSNGLLIRVPARWHTQDQQNAITELTQRLQHSLQKDLTLLTHAATWPTLTFEDNGSLSRYVSRLNYDTYKVAFSKARIGNAVSTRLAQANITTGTITVSRYCLHQAPAHALRYLILHELAHFIEANHSRRFWALVAQHEPQYRLMNQIMQAHHKLSALRANAAQIE
ncbi:MAG: M48 family metallopeptidase [Vampirovibrionales bacterium]|nr:M48 family metallopeptidase [Vampirovibrionales bacterium]